MSIRYVGLIGDVLNIATCTNMNTCPLQSLLCSSEQLDVLLVASSLLNVTVHQHHRIALQQLRKSSGFESVHLLSEALEQWMNALVCCRGFAASTIFHIDGVICTGHGAHGSCSPWELMRRENKCENIVQTKYNAKIYIYVYSILSPTWANFLTCGRPPNSPATTSSSASKSEAARTFWSSCCWSSLEENIKSSSSIPANFVITYEGRRTARCCKWNMNEPLVW